MVPVFMLEPIPPVIAMINATHCKLRSMILDEEQKQKKKAKRKKTEEAKRTTRAFLCMRVRYRLFTTSLFGDASVPFSRKVLDDTSKHA